MEMSTWKSHKPEDGDNKEMQGIGIEDETMNSSTNLTQYDKKEIKEETFHKKKFI